MIVQERIGCTSFLFERLQRFKDTSMSFYYFINRKTELIEVSLTAYIHFKSELEGTTQITGGFKYEKE